MKKTATMDEMPREYPMTLIDTVAEKRTDKDSFSKYILLNGNTSLITFLQCTKPNISLYTQRQREMVFSQVAYLLPRIGAYFY
tara:strand:+ start:2517 stop:2765 length:249 start_codon:yes stop_codon:yes gene_type:complete